MGSSSGADERLLAVARRLAAACPPALGREVAVTGSVGAGLADEHSDLELVFLVGQLPAVDDVREWLTGLDARDLLVGDDGSGIWAWCQLDGVEVEPYWATVDETEREISAIAAGEVVDHRRLALAYVLTHCIVLRSEGALARWQDCLRDYPGGLQRRLIADALGGLDIPSPRLGALVRGDRLEVESRLVHDAQRVMRIVFALNRRWEPPRWKWLRHHAASLDDAPSALADRIVAALIDPDAVAAARAMLELLRDTLALVPDDFEVGAARRGTDRRLAAVSKAAA